MAISNQIFSFFDLLSSRGVKIQGPQFQEMFVNYRNLIPAGIEAIERTLKGDIPDPTVGENACTIRAVMFSEFLNCSNSNQILIQAKNKLESVFNRLKNIEKPFITGDSSFNEFLEDAELNVTLDERVYRLISAHLLTLSRAAERSFKRVDRDNIQPVEEIKQLNFLKTTLHLTTNISRKVEKEAKKYLSKASVLYLQQIAKMISPKEKFEQLYRLVSGANVLLTPQKLCTAPCFSSAQILFRFACIERIPLVIKIHLVDPESATAVGAEVFFFISDGTADYSIIKKEAACTSNAVIMIHAVSISQSILTREQLETHFQNRKIMEMILAFMATHPVYGGQLKSLQGPEEENDIRKKYAEKAFDWGCSPDNPLVFRPYHIFAMASSQL